MPLKRRSQSWAELKQAGNECFKTGQYGEAVSLYSQAIKEVEKSGKKNSEDLSILYSNRAASYLKDGNCGECVKDCTVSLDLVPFGIKPLLRRAAAYEALERYRLAYVDYKTVLQIDCNIPAAHEGTNRRTVSDRCRWTDCNPFISQKDQVSDRMTKCLTEVDGLSWREKLPPIPTVPMAVKEKLSQASNQHMTQHNGTPGKKTSALGEADIKKGQSLKEEGNGLVKKGEYRKAIEKYTQSLKYNSSEITTYTNRALCYLTIKMYKEAVRDCEEALQLDNVNVKALYRRAQAHKELKNYKACVEDLNNLLKVEPKNTAAQKLLLEVQKK